MASSIEGTRPLCEPEVCPAEPHERSRDRSDGEQVSEPEVCPSTADIASNAATGVVASSPSAYAVDRIFSRAAHWDRFLTVLPERCLAVVQPARNMISRVGSAANGARSVALKAARPPWSLVRNVFTYTSGVTQPLRNEIAEDMVQCLRTADDFVARGRAEPVIVANVEFGQALAQRVKDAATNFARIVLAPFVFIWNIASHAFAFFAYMASLWIAMLSQMTTGARKVSVYTAAVVSDPISWIAGVAGYSAAALASQISCVSGGLAKRGWSLSVTSADASAHIVVKGMLCTYRAAKRIVWAVFGVARSFWTPSAVAECSEGLGVKEQCGLLPADLQVTEEPAEKIPIVDVAAVSSSAEEEAEMQKNVVNHVVDAAIGVPVEMAENEAAGAKTQATEDKVLEKQVVDLAEVSTSPQHQRLATD